MHEAMPGKGRMIMKASDFVGTLNTLKSIPSESEHVDSCLDYLRQGSEAETDIVVELHLPGLASL